ncbi:helix-turn-helix domain-containing protein [Accumulibacter sp.]|uniref:helix-turn-helix domain-containing protein n=1 Tax=Accumulibacter sp. TaxID=2053492 RepID=UPI0025E69342|nr:helix-turn-helix domain-containing protein [Accumulibacter sp.]MCM8613495.1 helix-turn-helix domain-containing protein [Accumulibacter sp.]MCM8637190.1 helix-turn-helix domain-containing protein [Accumulibacter sp.]MCM8640746.1 helix-turn-helix domain-containing protein [Accumulibacter sp.]
MTTEPWIFVELVARHLDVTEDTVYRWRKHRELPAHRVGRQRKFKLSEVDDTVRAGARMLDKARAAAPPASTEAREAPCPH